MAWKTEELHHSLSLSALGQQITIVGPAGTQEDKAQTAVTDLLAADIRG